MSKIRDFAVRYSSSRFVTNNRLASELEEKMLEILKKENSRKL